LKAPPSSKDNNNKSITNKKANPTSHTMYVLVLLIITQNYKTGDEAMKMKSVTLIVQLFFEESVQFSSVQFSSVQFSSVQFSYIMKKN